jgi:hypothetical protein
LRADHSTPAAQEAFTETILFPLYQILVFAHHLLYQAVSATRHVVFVWLFRIHRTIMEAKAAGHTLFGLLAQQVYFM